MWNAKDMVTNLGEEKAIVEDQERDGILQVILAQDQNWLPDQWRNKFRFLFLLDTVGYKIS